jgi:hypothetical protein
MWECAIEGCGRRTETATTLLVHQATDHERVRCAVCGTYVPDGYFALEHVFSEHTRAQYRRGYDASTDDVRHREAVIEAVEREVDVETVAARLRDDTTTEAENETE